MRRAPTLASGVTTWYDDGRIKMWLGVLSLNVSFQDRFQACAPLYIHLARFHAPPVTSPQLYFAHVWAAALVGCILTCGWSAIPQLVRELQQALLAAADISSAYKSAVILVAASPLGRYLSSASDAIGPTSLSVSSADGSGGLGSAAAVAAVAAALSSPLLNRPDQRMLADWFIACCSSSIVIETIVSISASARSPLPGSEDALAGAPPYPLPLNLTAFLCNRSALRVLLLNGSDPNAVNASPMWEKGDNHSGRDDWRRMEFVPPLAALLAGLRRLATVRDAPAQVRDAGNWCGVVDDLVAAGANVSVTSQGGQPLFDSFIRAISRFEAKDGKAKAAASGWWPELVAQVAARLVSHGAAPPMTPQPGDFEGEDDGGGALRSVIAEASAHAGVEAHAVEGLLTLLRSLLPPGYKGVWTVHAADVSTARRHAGRLAREANWARRKHWIALRERLREQGDVG